MTEKEATETYTSAADKAPKENREALVFLHIPKTAGTTLNRIIDEQYSLFSIFAIDPHRTKASVERLKRLPEARRRRLRVVRGHLAYGIHEYLPQGATYITLLRDPVARVLSAYHFILRRPLNPLHRKLKTERLGVEDCVRMFPQFQNLQCRFIAGVKNAASNDDERLLHIAKWNLTRSFSVVGICERFEESLMLISQRLGWEVSFYENRRVAKSRPKVAPELADFVRAHNQLDDELYKFGKNLFEEALRKNEGAVREGLKMLRTIPRRGPVKRFYDSSTSATRFLCNKIVSAI